MRATSVDHAIGALESFGEDAKVLAGGQSLLAAMNFRLARPTALIDIGALSDLERIRVDHDTVELGALVRHRTLEIGGVIEGPLGPLLSSAARAVGHLPIRTRGTFGGSIAHADPASEWCVLASLLDAEMVIASNAGERVEDAESFFTTVFTTTLGPAEVLTSVRLPLLTDRHHVGFCEFTRRPGDFAIVMAMVMLEVVDDLIVDARVALGGVSDRPVRCAAAEQVLRGQRPEEAVFATAADAAARAVTPRADVHGPSQFRQDLARVFVARALDQTRSDAQGASLC